MNSIVKIFIILFCGAVFAMGGFFAGTILFERTVESIERDRTTVGSAVVLKVAGRSDRLDWQTGGIIIFGLIGVGGTAGVIMFFEKKQTTQKKKKKSTSTSQKKRKRRSTNLTTREPLAKRKRRRKRSD